MYVFFGPKNLDFWPKNGSYPKESPKMTFPPLIIWAKALFFFEQLFTVMAKTWLEYRSDFFWGPKSQFLAKKSDFCHTTPILVNCPFVALGECLFTLYMVIICRFLMNDVLSFYFLQDTIFRIQNPLGKDFIFFFSLALIYLLVV